MRKSGCYETTAFLFGLRGTGFCFIIKGRVNKGNCLVLFAVTNKEKTGSIYICRKMEKRFIWIVPAGSVGI